MKRLTYLLPIAVLALVAFVAAGCGGSDKKTVPRNAIAVVGDQEITKAEFDAFIRQAKKGYRQQKRPFPKAGSPEYNTLKQQIVSYLVGRTQYEQAAEDLGVEVSDKDVRKRLDDMKKQYFKNNEKKYRQQLAQQGVSEQQLLDDMRYRMIADKVTKKVTDDVKVSEDDIEAYYKKNKATYETPESREVRHILVKDKQTANKLYNQLQNGANFAILAKKFSLDPGSKLQGGKLTVTKGQFVAPFEQTAFLLGTGKISRPVKTQYGYHIIEPLSKTKPAHTKSLKEVRELIKQQLLQTKRDEALRKWADDVRKDYAEKTSYQVGFAPPKTSTSTTETK